jgi:thymidylate synthase
MEESYLKLLSRVMASSSIKSRNGDTRSIFGAELSCNLEDGFPLLTTKKMFWNSIVEELLFFIRGDTDTSKLKSSIWKKNTSAEFLKSRGLPWKEGEMGPMYGYNWRHFGRPFATQSTFHHAVVDQLNQVIQQLIIPGDRRVMMTTLNPLNVDQGVLPPCHGIVTQFYNDGVRIHCKTYQRSADAFLGLPFNIASYALLTHIIAKILGYKVGDLTISLGCVHIYEEHFSAVEEQLTRSVYPPPTLEVFVEDIDCISPDMIWLKNYTCHSAIRAEMKA